MNILAIDPGKQNGIAYYKNGTLDSLITVSKYELLNDLFKMTNKIDLIVIEDSRMQSFIFQGNAKTGSREKAMKISRDIGGIDAICSIIQNICDHKAIPMISISPKGKGRKVDHETFCKITGWKKQTNQHERDAGMLGWTYRNSSLTKQQKSG